MNAASMTAVEDLLQAPLALLDRRFAQRTLSLPSGAQLAVRECGPRSDRPSVVLLHGISSGAASWLHAALAAAGEVHLIAWDAPGYGDSTALPGQAPTDTDYAARLHELLLALGVRRCVLVGHSLGALMACAYARGPGASRVSRVVLISPAGGYGAPAQADARTRVRSERREALQTLGVSGLAARMAQRLLSPAASAAARAWVQWNSARLQPAGYLQAVELLCTSDLGRSQGLTMPVEIHCGDADGVTTPAACLGWAERHGATFSLIESAGHASPIEQPEAVARIITRAAQQPDAGPHHG